MFKWRPYSDESSPNHDALHARDGDNCLFASNLQKPLLAATLGETIDIAKSYESIGDDYHSEINYRWPKDPIVYVPTIELRFRGGTVSAPEAGEPLYRACQEHDLYPGALIVGLPAGGSCEVIRITPNEKEFGERFFTPESLAGMMSSFSALGLLDESDAALFTERFVRKSLELAASTIVMRYEEYQKEIRLSDFRSLKSSLDFGRMLSPGKKDEEDLDIEEYRRQLLAQPFVQFHGEFEALSSPEQMLEIFRRLADDGDYSALEQHELTLMQRLTDEWPIGRPLADVHPRLSLDMARLGRQFGRWFQNL
jgi:hypothetical protein